jgi:iron complex transport system ATP-binding protein
VVRQMYQAHDINYAINGRPILRGVSFSASAGEVTIIIGPNGSGKSTLLKALTGEISTSGSIAINGNDLARLKPWEAASMRAVLPQASVLTFPFLVREVIRLGLSEGYSGSAIAGRRLTEQALAAVDLAGFAGRYYNDLSGGEQQRVQLARVLCQVWEPVVDNAPRYLLLDEPISSLDIRHQLQIMDIARNYADRGGAVIAILHDLNLALMYADRLAVMSNGEMVAQDRTDLVLTDHLLETVFGCPLRINHNPAAQQPFVLPQSARG